jgi:hypothetical protein
MSIAEVHLPDAEESAAVRHELGEVLSHAGEAWRVRTATGVQHAKRALDCLVTPRPGDRVLLVCAGSQAWVLSVLSRPDDDAATTLSAPGDIQILASKGRVGVVGRDGVDLVSTREVCVETDGFHLRTRTARMVVESLHWLGARLNAEIDAVRMVGRLFDSVLDRFSRRAKRSYRRVDELDHVRSEQIDYRARSNMSLRGRNVFTSADELVKLDGDQIHLG